MKLKIILALGLALVSFITLAQTADDYVAQGRALLAAHDLPNANSRFISALALSPTHTNANVLRAATRLLTLQNQPAGKALLDKLGFSATGRITYAWTANVPRDGNGTPLAPANMSAAELSAYLRTNVLLEIIGAGTNLAIVTDTNFSLSLTSNETATVAVTLDYGDVLLVRAGLKFAEYAGYTVHSWNVDAQLTAVESVLTNGPTTAEKLLSQLPALFTFTSTNELQTARQAFSNAVTLYLNASALIRNRPANEIRLFNYDAGEVENENNFRTTITEVNQSLNGPVVLSLDQDLTVSAGNHFKGTPPPRALFPRVAGNSVVAGTLPDPTLGGIIQGAADYELEEFMGRGVPFVSRFTVPQRLPGGAFQISLDALENSFYLIQASTNLQTWTNLATGVAQQGVVTFTDSNATASPKRYYRALDRSDTVSVGGIVYDALTGNPISNATLAMHAGGGVVTNFSDSAGRFLVMADAYGNYFYDLEVAAVGYAPLSVGGYSRVDQHRSTSLYLAPTGFHPPNDDFAQCQSLAGTNAIAIGSNVGATHETAEPYFGPGQSVWWCWTAPASGAVIVDTAGSSFDTLLGIYIGNSVSTLFPVAQDDNGGSNQTSLVNFLVTAGKTYHFAVDGAYSGINGRIVLNLHAIAPQPPSISAQPQSRTVAAGTFLSFDVPAVGTAPLYYQWRKNGVDLPGETYRDYYLGPVQTNDAGSYSVVISNSVGSAVSSNAVLAVVTIPPRITGQPGSEIVGAGDFVSLSVAAMGAPPPAYQWQKDGVSIPNATGSAYAIAAVQASHAGTYSVVVSNNGGIAMSSNASLVVITVPPTNDAFVDRIFLSGVSDSVTGYNFLASVEPGEADHSFLPGGKSVWWSWTAPTNGTVTFSTSGSSFDTVLSIYTGTSVAGLTLITGDDDNGGEATSLVTLYTGANETYQISVDGYGGAAGIIQMSVGLAAGQNIGAGVELTALHAFNPGGLSPTVNTEGANPASQLLQGRDSLLYGTASAGGTNGAGTVFSLSPKGNRFTVLHTFSLTGAGQVNVDGAAPYAGLIQGTDGRLYGTTSAGGTNGGGTVFTVLTNGSGFAVVRAFTNGAGPYGGLIQGQDGRLYGTTPAGGTNSLGTVFCLGTNGSGFAELHTFAPFVTGLMNDGGAYPSSGLVQGSDGRLYGTAYYGGAYGAGVVYALGTNGAGFTVLHTFTGSANDGASPWAGLLMGIDGRLYGTTSYGGRADNGTAFTLRRDGSGFALLHSFSSSNAGTGANWEGVNPLGALLQGNDGKLYGAASAGGASGAGTLFRVGTTGEAFTLLCDFGLVTNQANGSSPYSALCQGRDGRIYGAATYGGSNSLGTVFALTPAPPSLSIARVANLAVLSWPFWGASYRLESSGAARGGIWTGLTNGVTAAGDFLVVSNSLSVVPTFFRLNRP